MKRFSSQSSRRSTAWWIASLLLLLCTACSESDEYVYVDDTDADSGVVTPTVVGENGDTATLPTGQTLGIYATDDEGNVTVVTTVVGSDGSIVVPASVRGLRQVACLPYQETWGEDALTTPQPFQVAADQTAVEDFTASDLMIGTAEATRAAAAPMTFRHVMAQVVIHIIDETGANDFNDCGVTLREVSDAVMVDLNEQSVETVGDHTADIAMLPFVVSDHRLSLKAIVAPQQIEAGIRFITFLNNGFGRRYSIPHTAVIESGRTYTFSMRLTATGLEFIGSSINDWDETDEEELRGEK